jgi:predicted secreted protein
VIFIFQVIGAIVFLVAMCVATGVVFWSHQMSQLQISESAYATTLIG